MPLALLAALIVLAPIVAAFAVAALIARPSLTDRMIAESVYADVYEVEGCSNWTEVLAAVDASEVEASALAAVDAEWIAIADDLAAALAASEADLIAAFADVDGANARPAPVAFRVARHVLANDLAAAFAADRAACDAAIGFKVRGAG
jgi:hypothetical protein